jgi:rhomboid protease GluP
MKPISAKNGGRTSKAIALSVIAVTAIVAGPTLLKSFRHEPLAGVFELCVFAVILFFVIRRGRYFQIADLVLDCGDYLQIHQGSREYAVEFRNITQVVVNERYGVATITVRFFSGEAKPGGFSFIPGERLSLDASTAHTTAAALSARAEKARTTNPLPAQVSIPQTGTGEAGLAIRFSPPGANKWFVARTKSRWQWTGEGAIAFEGDETVIRGRRTRFLWFPGKQEIRFASSDVINVVLEGLSVRCEVKQSYGKPEPLVFWASDDASARRIASHWPTERTAAFSQALADREAFDAALKSIGTKVVVTPTLVALNVLAFAFVVLRGVDAMHPSGADLVPWGSNYALKTLNGEWWRLFTSMYLHFGLFHLLFNMWALGSMGPLVERLIGSARFLLLYLFAGLCGSIASLLWNPLVNSAGASGAIFGVLGALLAFMVNPKTKIPTTVSTVQRNSALSFIAYNLLNGVAHSGIDNACHIGGLVGGFAMGWLVARPLDPEARHEEVPGLAAGFLIGMVALFALSWPLTHPSPETLAKRQFRLALTPFVTLESQALSRAAQLLDLRSKKEISEHDWARRQLREVLPLWERADDAVYGLDTAHNAGLEQTKAALLNYLNSRKLGVQLQAEATQADDSVKAEWAANVLNSSDAKAKVAYELLKSQLR